MDFSIINYIDCTEKQIRDIFEMRNREELRRWASDQHVIGYEEHVRFVESLRHNPDKLYYAVFLEGKLIGSYNLHNTSDGVWERGLFASPEYQGKGLTSQWEEKILESLPPKRFEIIEAEVKVDNDRSIGYHYKMGFKETGRDKDYVYFEKSL